MRCDYAMILEIRPTQAISHGMGTEGNEQVLLTRQVLVPSDDLAGMERVEIPCVSGSALKATLRQHAATDALHRAGIASATRDHLRLLYKGGQNASGGASVPLEEARRLRDLFPLLAVFGSMDGGLPIAGRIQVSDVRPWCTELDAAGLLPRQVTPLVVEADGEPRHGPAIPVWPDVQPVPAALIRSVETNYRHDMRTSPAALFLEGEAAKQIEDASAARKDAGNKAKKTERREANESMPYSRQVIVAGTPMVAEIRLQGATEAEYGCLLLALFSWIASGAHLGGAGSTGHGACTVRISGAIEWSPPSGVVAAGTAIAVPSTPEAAAARAYVAHVDARRDQIREYLGAVAA